jgi:hypothetical protein
MTNRRIEALRALADRPGTEAEGFVAREKLARALGARESREPISSYRDFLRTGALDDLRAAVGPKHCNCGAVYAAFTACPEVERHEQIRREIRAKFPLFSRVYYNCWAYEANCPGVVVRYGSTWNWIVVKFDHLKKPRPVPIFDGKGWHLSSEPIDAETLRQTGIRGGMEKFESVFGVRV